jgi:hypothetical protein
MIKTKKKLPRFKYDKSKAEEYQLALTTNLGNMWVIDSIGHLGVNMLANLLHQCVGVVVESNFGNKPLGGSWRKRHCHKAWFDADYYTTKCELRLCVTTPLWAKCEDEAHTTKSGNLESSGTPENSERDFRG